MLNRILGLLLPTCILIVASVAILHSIVPVLAPYQLLFAIVGLLLAFFVSRFDLDLLTDTEWFWYGLTMVSLALTELFGVMSRGSTRWFSIFGYQFQTSEFAKIGLIIFTCLWLSKHQLTQFKAVVRYLGLISLPILLVFLQPDLGSAITLSIIGLLTLVAAGIPGKHLFTLSLVVIAGIPIFVKTLKPYQIDRITSFSNPGKDRLGSGYNAIQATIAVGSGQLRGRGLGQGTQSHLKFLPERHTDFIFASFVEELGLIGGSIIILSYVWLISTLIQIARLAKTSAQSLMCLASASLILGQMGVNLGMNTGILPITGITLPFVSYGGSSLISLCLIIGINWSIVVHSKGQTNHLEIH